MIPRDHITRIIYFAAQAPSGDNAQPWRFEVHGNEIELFNVPGQDYSPYNFRERGSYFAHGAAIENLVIAASSFGYSTEVALFPDAGDDTHVAHLTLAETHAATDPLFACIIERVTNRKPYRQKALTPDHQNQLSAVAMQKFLMVSDPAQIKQFAKTVSLSDQLIFEEKSIHDAIFHSIRWTPDEEKEKRGMYIKTLELPPPAKAMFSLLRNWRILTALNHIGISKFIAGESAKVYASAPTIGMVIVPDTTTTSYVEAGRSFERFWLMATQLGVGIQPVTALAYLAERVAAGDAGELSPQHATEITQAQENDQRNLRQKRWRRRDDVPDGICRNPVSPLSKT
jgi:hypothetical protein